MRQGHHAEKHEPRTLLSCEGGQELERMPFVKREREESCVEDTVASRKLALELSLLWPILTHLSDDPNPEIEEWTTESRREPQ